MRCEHRGRAGVLNRCLDGCRRESSLACGRQGRHAGAKPRAVPPLQLKGPQRAIRVPPSGILRGQARCPFLPRLGVAGPWAPLIEARPPGHGSCPATREQPRGKEPPLFTPSLCPLGVSLQPKVRRKERWLKSQLCGWFPFAQQPVFEFSQRSEAAREGGWRRPAVPLSSSGG